MAWRKNVDPIIKDYLDLQIRETIKFKQAYEKAKNKPNAQLWIAIANMAKHMFNLELKIKYLEGTIKDLNEKFLELTEKKPEDVLRELEKEVKKKKVNRITKKNTIKKKAKKKTKKKATAKRTKKKQTRK